MRSKLCNTGPAKRCEGTVKAYPEKTLCAFTRFHRKGQSVKAGESTVKAAFTGFGRYLSQGESVKAYSLLRAIKQKSNEIIGNIESKTRIELVKGAFTFTLSHFGPRPPQNFVTPTGKGANYASQ